MFLLFEFRYNQLLVAYFVLCPWSSCSYLGGGEALKPSATQPVGAVLAVQGIRSLLLLQVAPALVWAGVLELSDYGREVPP